PGKRSAAGLAEHLEGQTRGKRLVELRSACERHCTHSCQNAAPGKLRGGRWKGRPRLASEVADLPAELAARFGEWQKRAIDCFAGVTEEAAAWRPARGPQSLLWQLWHIARWDDRFAWIIADRAPGLRNAVPKVEIWLQDSVARRWGWPVDLKPGVSAAAGTGLSFDENAALLFPGIQPVIDYA